MRELENVVERAVALAETASVRLDDLPAAVRERRNAEQDPLARALARDLTLDELEREYIQRVLQAEGGNKTRAAQRLGLDRKTLYRKLEEYAARPVLDAERTSVEGDGAAAREATADADVPDGDTPSGGVINR